jgi:hypothetical protein
MGERDGNNSSSSFLLLALALMVGLIACFGGIEGRSSITAYDDEFVESVSHDRN